jgi:hypothetical protein
LSLSDQTEHQRSHYRLKTRLSTEFDKYMLGMRLDRFWRYAQVLRHALIGMTPTNKLQNDVLTWAEVHIVRPRARVFFTHLRKTDGLGDVRVHYLQSPNNDGRPIRAASSFGGSRHDLNSVAPC